MLKETVILSSNISGSEKLKSLASFNKKTFNTRYFSTYELAHYLLERSGVTIEKEFIQDDILVAAIYNNVKVINYFKDFSYNDLRGVLDSINDLRHYIADNEKEEIVNKLLSNSEFVAKNKVIIGFYAIFTHFLDKNNMIDELGIIRLAYEKTKVFPSIDFEVVEGDKLTRQTLDMALLNKASDNHVKFVNYPDEVKISSYTKAFSQLNEIENVINYINKNKIPFDECIIAAAEEKDYSTILNNYKDQLNLPVVIGIGANIINTNPGRLYSLLNEYEENLYHTDFLRRIIHDLSFNKDEFKKDLDIPPDEFVSINQALKLSYFESLSLDSIITTVGDLKLSFDSKKNQERFDAYDALITRYQKENISIEETQRRIIELPYVKRFKEALDRGLSFFIDKYSVINDEYDENALMKILKCLAFVSKCGVKKKDIDKVIYNQPVGRKSIDREKLYFTTIGRASSVLRKHLFIVGLSSSNYPGNNKEDPYLLDNDYKAFGVNNASNRTIENNRHSYFSLIKEASSLGIDIHLSYAYYNSITLKTQNASSVLFDTYKMEYGQDKIIKNFEKEFEAKEQEKFVNVEYFDTNLTPINKIGKSLKNNKREEYLENEYREEVPDTKINDDISSKPLSATNVEKFVECPYEFYMSVILKIPQTSIIDVFDIMPANHLGSLVHSLLEDFDKKNISKDDFLLLAGNRFDEYFIIHHTDNKVLVEKEKIEFLEMMSNAYDMDEGLETKMAEEDIYYYEPTSKITIHGKADKIITLSNGQYVAIDYKTKRTVAHDLKNKESLIQCIMYCYILYHKKKFDMKGFAYRYLRDKRDVASDEPMDNYYLVLEDVLQRIRKSYDTGKFDANTDHCKKCYYADICPRRKK